MSKEEFARTLYDMQGELQWVRLLGWAEDELRAVRVHGHPTSGEERLNLANFGGTPLGDNIYTGGETSADARSIPNMYVFRSDTPEELWNRLAQLIDKGGPSGYEDGVFGERGERDSFPPE